MDLILASVDGRDIRRISNAYMDIDLNDTRDFELKISRDSWNKDLTFGNRVYVQNTEYGGVIGAYSTDTSADTVTLSGYTWRGMLNNKIIEPPNGSDYRVVSGDANNILKELIESEFDGLFKVLNVPSINIHNFQFDRYVTLLSGIYSLLKSVGYRLELSYNSGIPGGTGFIEVSAVPIIDYSSQIELSQDSRLNFKMSDIKNGVNHLIGLGKGELKERHVLHLYAHPDGSIKKTPYYTGKDEIAQKYENTSASTDEFENECIKSFEKLMNYQSFEMDVEELEMDVSIGDIVGGRDYLTGMYLKKPIENKIIIISDGVVKKEYRLEGA